MFVLWYIVYCRSLFGSSALAFQVVAFASSHGAKMSEIPESRHGSKSGSGSRAGSKTRCGSATEARQRSGTRKPAKDGTALFCFSYATAAICKKQGINCGAKHLHSCGNDQVKEFVDNLLRIENECIEKDALKGIRNKGVVRGKSAILNCFTCVFINYNNQHI